MPERIPAVSIVRNALCVACRAPSVHNSQPWHWVLGAHTLRLYVDRRRLVNVADRSGREAIISCGAVLDHARVAFEAAGWMVEIDRFPNAHDNDHLATFAFRPLDFVIDEQLHRAPRVTASADPGRRRRPDGDTAGAEPATAD